MNIIKKIILSDAEKSKLPKESLKLLVDSKLDNYELYLLFKKLRRGQLSELP